MLSYISPSSCSDTFCSPAHSCVKKYLQFFKDGGRMVGDPWDSLRVVWLEIGGSLELACGVVLFVGGRVSSII